MDISALLNPAAAKAAGSGRLRDRASLSLFQSGGCGHGAGNASKQGGENCLGTGIGPSISRRLGGAAGSWAAPLLKRHSTGFAMHHYRLFIFDRFGRTVEEMRDLRAVDDTAAVLLANGWRQARKAQLWDGGRQVRSWGPGAALFDA
jgi:hypothetical protein